MPCRKAHVPCIGGTNTWYTSMYTRYRYKLHNIHFVCEKYLSSTHNEMMLFMCYKDDNDNFCGNFAHQKMDLHLATHNICELYMVWQNVGNRKCSLYGLCNL